MTPAFADELRRLHKSFYGFAYTPLNVQEPQCGAVQANITEDIQLMSQLTSSSLFSTFADWADDPHSSLAHVRLCMVRTARSLELATDSDTATNLRWCSRRSRTPR